MEKIFNKLTRLRANRRLKQNLEAGLADIRNSRVFNYRQYLQNPTGKRALVSYVVNPVIEELSEVSTELFSNSGAGRTIPKVLNQLGYTVDVINWDDTDELEGEYDLAVYHGGKNFNSIKKLKKPSTKLVYYSTGSYWQFHNDEEKKRFEYFEKRHHTTMKMDREIKDSEEEANSVADAIIALGNKDAAKTYSKFQNVYNLEGASMSIVQPRQIIAPTDGKIGFLFLAGPGNIHKGLDVILDAWQKVPKNYELYIITYLEDDFTKFYQKELYKSENVHTHGYVPQRSKKFYEIINQCQYSILLSCSEGSPGSVAESMHQGLIPIVSKASHIDLPKQGVTIDPISVENAIDGLVKLAKHDLNSVVGRQLRVQKWADSKLSPARYESNFADIIGKIVK